MTPVLIIVLLFVVALGRIASGGEEVTAAARERGAGGRERTVHRRGSSRRRRSSARRTSPEWRQVRVARRAPRHNQLPSWRNGLGKRLVHRAPPRPRRSGATGGVDDHGALHGADRPLSRTVVRHEDDRGTVTVFVVGFMLALLLVAGLVFDGGNYSRRDARLPTSPSRRHAAARKRLTSARRGTRAARGSISPRLLPTPMRT